MEVEEGRAERKKREVRERIVDAAACLVIAKGARTVSMDEVAEKADVARRTLFNYFESKDELLYAAASPVLLEAISLAGAALAKPSLGVDDIVDLCLALWRSCGRRLGLLYAVELDESPRFAELHGRYLGLLHALIDKVAAGDPALADSARLVGKIVYRSFVPLLLALEGEDGAEPRFAAGLKGLIEGACARPGPAGPAAAS